MHPFWLAKRGDTNTVGNTEIVRISVEMIHTNITAPLEKKGYKGGGGTFSCTAKLPFMINTEAISKDCEIIVSGNTFLVPEKKKTKRPMTDALEMQRPTKKAPKSC